MIEEVSDASLGNLMFLVFPSLVVCLMMTIQGLKSNRLQLKGISSQEEEEQLPWRQNWQTA